MAFKFWSLRYFYGGNPRKAIGYVIGLSYRIYCNPKAEIEKRKQQIMNVVRLVRFSGFTLIGPTLKSEYLKA